MTSTNDTRTNVTKVTEGTSIPGDAPNVIYITDYLRRCRRTEEISARMGRVASWLVAGREYTEQHRTTGGEGSKTSRPTGKG